MLHFSVLDGALLPFKRLAGLCTCSAFLGILEVMLATSSPFYLSMFYQRKELGLRMAFLLGTATRKLLR